MKSPGARIIRWRIKPALHILLLLPAASLVWGAFNNGLGVNPVETLTHSTGEWGLRILLLALAVTPLARITKSGWVLQVRRLVGLYAFFYGLVHFLIYLVFDLALDFGFLVEDVLERPYITVGFSAFVILLVLAATSTIAIRQRLGRTWVRIHQTVYVAGLLAVLHYLWITRIDDTEPLVYGAVLVLLLAYRLIHFLKKKRPGRTSRPSPAAMDQGG